MRRSQASIGWRAYLKVVVSRSVSTTIVLLIHRMILATMQAELVSWRNVPGRN
jgi:hypothetical protein